MTHDFLASDTKDQLNSQSELPYRDWLQVFLLNRQLILVEWKLQWNHFNRQQFQ